MALWQNGRKYPAVVQKMEQDGSVSVQVGIFPPTLPNFFGEIKWTSSHFPLFQFYDGFVKSVRPINVRRLLASDSEFVRHCKEEQMQLVGF